MANYEQLNKNRKVLFITDYKETSKNKSSTQVAINNIIKGFLENGIDLFVVAVIDSFTNKTDVDLELTNLGIGHFLIDSRINTDGKGKYKQLYSCMKAFFLRKRYYSFVVDSIKFEYDVIVSCCPGLESGIIQNVFKKNNKNKKTIQIWTDPYSAIGLESTTKLPLRRRVHSWLEKKLLSSADRIFYFTEVLCNIQRRLFSRYAKKMDFYNGCSTIDFEECSGDCHWPIHLVGYSGSFNHVRRNINPLCVAASKCPDLDFLVRGGGGVLENHDYSNLEISNTSQRLPREQVLKIEKTFDVNVCVCDKKGFMVPGKVFMQAALPNFVLVILDGSYKNEIRNYLSSFNRFVFAENDPEDIANALKSIRSLDVYPYSKDVLLQFSKKNSVSNIISFLKE